MTVESDEKSRRDAWQFNRSSSFGDIARSLLGNVFLGLVVGALFFFTLDMLTGSENWIDQTENQITVGIFVVGFVIGSAITSVVRFRAVELETENLRREIFQMKRLLRENGD